MTDLRPEARALIGTAGWSLPRIHQPQFPAAGSHLERYSAVFPAVEINSSFYRPHRKVVYERWAASTPEAFRFSVKAPKSITHSDAEPRVAELDAFFSEIAGLGEKRGAVLVQLPPKRAFSAADSRALLGAFRDRTDADIVLEPRHASWFAPDADALLTELGIARVAADPPRAAGADRPGGWTGLAYYRLHGSPDIYRSAYGRKRLEPLADSLRATRAAGSQIWCIFDNTTLSAATDDALYLLRALSGGDER